MTRLHEQKGLRGFGMPAPHGVVCGCGKVVPLDEWEQHLEGNVHMLWDNPATLLYMRAAAPYSMDLIMRGITEYVRKYGKDPQRIRISNQIYHDFVRQTLESLTYQTELVPSLQHPNGKAQICGCELIVDRLHPTDLLTFGKSPWE